MNNKATTLEGDPGLLRLTGRSDKQTKVVLPNSYKYLKWREE